MEKWFYDGIELTNNLAWGVEAILGGLGKPPLRGSNIRIPFANGTRWIKKKYDSKILVLSMWIVGNYRITGEQPNDIMTKLDENIDRLNKLFGKQGQHVLQRVMRNGEIREAKAEVYNDVTFKYDEDAGFCRFVVEFELSDPLFYGTKLYKESKFIDSTEYNFLMEHSGTAPNNNVKIILKGPLNSPKITNISNDIWVQYKGTIEKGQVVVIDTQDFSCMKDGENHITGITHGGDSIWFILEAGDNQIQINNSYTGGRVEFQFYPAYF